MTTKQQKKAAQRQALRDRLEAAQRDIYGNARTPWADDVPGFLSFYDWLGSYAEREAEYMTGERFGMMEHETRPPRWRPASERLSLARRYTSHKPARNNHGFPCGPFERERYPLLRYGVPQCYSYGRNGKTFYPTTYAHENGTGFHLRDVASESNAESLTDAVQWIEAFNAHVRSVAADAPAVYRDEAREALAERADDMRAGIRKARGQFATLAAELRALRGINAPAACDVLRERLRTLRGRVYSLAESLNETRATLAALDGAA